MHACINLYMQAIQFLETLSTRDCHVILADFDHLPDGIHGINGPVVQSKSEGRYLYVRISLFLYVSFYMYVCMYVCV
jgi:hypothetical protein